MSIRKESVRREKGNFKTNFLARVKNVFAEKNDSQEKFSRFA